MISKQTTLVEITPQTNTQEENSEYTSIDVCFMLDSTGSMQPTIDMARDKIKQIISELKAQYSGSQVRIAVVAYRDYKDTKRFEIFPFDDSVDSAYSFLASIQADGGGDNPEDVNGGFRKSLELEWKQYTTKMLYHLADAPCHGGRKFHDTRDDYPGGLPDDEKWEKIFSEVYNKDINYLYFDIGGNTEKMYKEFRMIYEKVGEEKAHLIFSYEKLHHEVKTFGKFRGYGLGKAISRSAMRGGEEEEEEEEYVLESYFPGKKGISRESKAETEFVSKTVSIASVQRQKNIEFRSVKKC